MVALTAAFALFWRGPWLAPFGIALGVWIVAGALSEWASRVKLFAAGREEVWRRARGLPRSAYGGTLAHAGIGLMVLGIVATTAWQSEHVVTLKVGERTEIAGFELTFRGVAPNQGPNYQEQVGLFAVTRGGSRSPSWSRPSASTTRRARPPPRPASMPPGRGDLYVVLGDALQDGSGWVVRAYFNPLVRLIWIGCLVMAFGGLLLAQRPPPARRRPAPRPPPAPRARGVVTLSSPDSRADANIRDPNGLDF